MTQPPPDVVGRPLQELRELAAACTNCRLYEHAYVTNLVKHFKFTQRGKRRIHAKPDGTEIAACRPWLDGEIAAVGPEVVVALGATAAKALLGSGFRVTKQRGEIIERDGLRYTATVHPSAVLRLDDEPRRAAFADLVDDLEAVAALLEG